MQSIKLRLGVGLALSLVLASSHPVSAEPPEALRIGAPVAVVEAKVADLMPEMIIQRFADLDSQEREEALVEAEQARAAEEAAAAAAKARQHVDPPSRIITLPTPVVSTRGPWPGCKAPNVSDLGEMQRIVTQAAGEYGVDPAQLLRIPPRESGWNADTQNCSSGACGLFQHLPGYWPGRAEAIGMPGADCRDPLANARAAAMMFSRSGFGPWYPSGPY